MKELFAFGQLLPMPIVHFSVLLVFKKFATHNTEQFQIQCAITQPSKPPTPKVGRAPLRNFTGKEYIFSKSSTEKEQYSFWININPDSALLIASRLKRVVSY